MFAECASWLYIALYATAGLVTSLGFISLGMIWFYSTLIAYLAIRDGQLNQHQEMMIYSYAACLSAVTLRIYLPLLVLMFHDFMPAYRLVSWLCWAPNIIVAFFLVRQLRQRGIGASI